MVIIASKSDTVRQSGRLALDFVNAERMLDTPPRLPASRTLTAEASILRTEIRRLFDAVSSGSTIEAVTLFTLNRAMAFGRRSTRLVVVDGAARVDTVDETDVPLAVLAPIARAAAELVAEADPRRLRQCASEECFSWFLDTSKGGQRRWCSMARCGNRSKAARYRAKREIVA